MMMDSIHLGSVKQQIFEGRACLKEKSNWVDIDIYLEDNFLHVAVYVGQAVYQLMEMLPVFKVLIEFNHFRREAECRDQFLNLWIDKCRSSLLVMADCCSEGCNKTDLQSVAIVRDFIYW